MPSWISQSKWATRLRRKRWNQRCREAEELFLRSQRLDAVGLLAGGVAHDFNNLLAIINGSAELVLEDVPLEAGFREDVVEILKAGRRAAKLTQQLLAFSRRQVLEPTRLDLNAIALEMERIASGVLGANVDLVLNTAPSLRQIYMDPGQMQQVLMNLVLNARDAMPDGGTLIIETSNIEIRNGFSRAGGSNGEPGVRLTICDDGAGMPERVRAKIFEPFFTTKGIGKGTGLGLAAVLGIVEQSRGFIEVHSEVGVGTTFNLYFPACEPGVTCTSMHRKRPCRRRDRRRVWHRTWQWPRACEAYRFGRTTRSRER